MRHSVIAVALFAGGIAVGLASSEVIHAQAPAFTTKQVLRTDLENLPGQEVWRPHRPGSRATACPGTCILTGTNSPT